MKYDFFTLADRRSQSSSKWHNMDLIDSSVINENIIPLSTADMEFLPPPQLTEGIKQYAEKLIFGYSYVPDSFKTALLGWMKKRHNYFPSKESIVNTLGVVPALFTSVRAFSDEGDGVVIMPPVYGPFFAAVERNQRKLLECNLINNNGKWEIDFARLEQIFKEQKPKLLLFCSPHNPVGRVWTEAELKKIISLCLEHKVILVSDEIHHDLIMPRNMHTVAASINKEIAENSVICTSSAKTFNLAGFPFSSIFIQNENMRKKFQQELDRIPGNVSSCLSFKANEIAYTQCEDWLDEVIAVIKENAELFKNHIECTVPEIKTYQPEATFLMWLDFRRFNIPQERLNTVLQQEARLFLTPGTFFGQNAGEGFARLNLAAPGYVIKEAAERLCKVFKTMHK